MRYTGVLLRRFRSTLTFLVLLPITAACSDQSRTHIEYEISYEEYVWNLPRNVPLPLVPPSNPMGEAKFQLGRHLFYDVRLSGNGTQSCANCHEQAKAFTDGKRLAVGSTGQVHHRSSMPLANIAYVPTLTWGNSSLRQLETQILIPLFGSDPIEQGISDSTLPGILQTLQADPTYRPLLKEAFPESEGSFSQGIIVDSLAVFVRGLTSFESPFDRFQRGESATLSAAAKRGRALYFGETLECFHCHGGYNLSNSTVDRTMAFVEKPFHNTGLYNIDGQGGFPEGNRGLFELTRNPSDMGKFRALSLRNVELTAPYMHDGSIATLSEVIDFYAAGGRNITEGVHAGDGRKNPFKDGFVTGFAIDAEQKSDLIEFLKSLTDRDFIENPRFSNPWPQP